METVLKIPFAPMQVTKHRTRKEKGNNDDDLLIRKEVASRNISSMFNFFKEEESMWSWD